MRVRLLYPYKTKKDGETTEFIPGEVADLPKEEALRLISKKPPLAEAVEGVETPAEKKATKIIDEAKKEIKQLKEQLKEKEQAIQGLGEQIDSLVTEVTEKDQQIQELIGQIEALTKAGEEERNKGKK